MKKTGKVALIVFAFAFAVFPLLSQTPAAPKPSFEVVSIKPSAPALGIRGGGPRGDRFNMAGATLRILLQQAYSRASNTPIGGQLQIINAPTWIDSDRYDIDARADCSGGTLTRPQLQLMIQSLLEDRFQLKSHMETRDLPIYNLVVAKDGPKIKRSEDQTPPGPAGGGPPLPCGPVPAAPTMPPPPPPPPPNPFGPRGFDPAAGLPTAPRGGMMMMMGPNGAAMSATAVPFANLVGMLQQQAGRPIVDKTELTGLYDFKLNFLPESVPGGIATPFGPVTPGPGGGLAGPAGAAPNSTAADPVPSIFTAVQEQLGLKLESAKGPVEVIVIESVQKPTEN